MKKMGATNRKVMGDAIVARASTLEASAKRSLKAPLGAFLAAHRALVSAQREVDDAHGARDEALAAVASADEALDAAVDALANALVAAGLGDRKNPFAAYGKLSPSAVVDLAYAREVVEARALTARIAKAKAPPKKALDAVNTAASAVEKALSAITKPQHAYANALAARDALLLDWQKQLARLKKLAGAALVDDDAAFHALFAPPPGEQSPRKRTSKKSSTKPA